MGNANLKVKAHLCRNASTLDGDAGFKIFVTSQSPGGGRSNSSAPPSYGLQRLAVHDGISCDACRQDPLRGTRYHCKDCPDYDICVPCQRAGKHPGHTLIEITEPLTREQNMRLMASQGNHGGMSEEDKIALALLLLALGAAAQDGSTRIEREYVMSRMRRKRRSSHVKTMTSLPSVITK